MMVVQLVVVVVLVAVVVVGGSSFFSAFVCCNRRTVGSSWHENIFKLVSQVNMLKLVFTAICIIFSGEIVPKGRLVQLHA